MLKENLKHFTPITSDEEINDWSIKINAGNTFKLSSVIVGTYFYVNQKKYGRFLISKTL